MDGPTPQLLSAVYHVLHLRTPRTSARKAMMTFAELVAEISRFPGVPHDLAPNDRRLHAALAELTMTCRAHHLPSLAALVTCSGTREPSEAYYAAAHPHAIDAESRRTQWQKEADDASLTLYPKRLIELATV